MQISVAALPAALAYSGDEGVAKWEGYVVSSEVAFRAFLTGPVADRARDTEFGESFENELRGLAATGMGTRHLANFLASVGAERGWEIGEAFAESVLALDGNREVVWPWNHVRNRRTPAASLPGADLVGFCRDAQGFGLLFGEVKTSSDVRVPPQVRATLREGGEGPWQQALGDLGPTYRTVWSIIEAEGASRAGIES